MSAEVVFLQEFFVVVGHANQVELGQPEGGVDPSGVNIPMDHALVVHEGQGFTELSEDAEHFIGRELLLAVGFPAGDVVGSLGVKEQGPIVIDDVKLLSD